MTKRAMQRIMMHGVKPWRQIFSLSLLASLAACTSTQAPDVVSASVTDTVTISIVGTNDVHGALLGAPHIGGMELLSGYVNNLRALRAADGGTVLLIDAGDMWQGTLESNLTEGASVVAAYNALDYTAAAFGNHEFDFGPVGPRSTPDSTDDDPQGAMKSRAVEAQFPMLAANLIDLTTGAPVDWENVQPSVMVDAGDVKVGIIGVMTEQAIRTTILANSQGLRVDPIVPTVTEYANRLRAAGAAIIIVTAHAGSQCEDFSNPVDLSSCDHQGEIFRVANALLPGTVDVIIAGHDHSGIAHIVNGIAVASAFARNSAIDRIDLEVDPVTGMIVSRKIHAPQALCRYLSVKQLNCAEQTRPDLPLAAAMYAGQPVIPDIAMAETIAPAIEQAQEMKMEEIGIFLETEFLRGPIPESSVGNLLMDALLESAADADFAIHNSSGGIRADLPRGELQYGSLYEMFPFDNRMTTIELSGAELRRVLTDQMRSPHWRAGFSGGTIIARCVDKELQITVVRPWGAEVGDDEVLRIVTADFLVTGGDAIFSNVIPPDGFAVDDDAPFIRDVLQNWLSERGGAISADMFHDENSPRFIYESPPPIDCTKRRR